MTSKEFVFLFQEQNKVFMSLETFRQFEKAKRGMKSFPRRKRLVYLEITFLFIASTTPKQLQRFSNLRILIWYQSADVLSLAGISWNVGTRVT
jgi:hypothetical protein